MDNLRKILRHLFLHRKREKSLALLLAIGSWYAIQEAISFKTWIRDIPVKFVVDEGWAILDRSSSTVDILFQGAQDAVHGLERGLVDVTVDYRGKGAQEDAQIEVLSKFVKAPGGVRAVEIQPQTIRLTLDQEDSRMFPVEPEIIGDPPAGYAVGKVRCEPESVTVFGPHGKLKSIKDLKTEPIGLEGRVRSFTLSAEVEQPSERWDARITPAFVKVFVELEERSGSVTFEDIPVGILSQGKEFKTGRIKPARVRISISGRPDQLQALDPADVRAFVDVSVLPAEGSNASEYAVQVYLPPELKLVRVTPPSVSIDLSN